MIRALVAALLLLAACSRSTGGPLEPVEAPGISVSEDANGNRVATVQAAAVSARVTARWSDTGGQSAMLVYANRGPTAARIDLATLAMTGPAGEAVIMSAADISNTNLLDTRTDNDDVVALLQRDGNGNATGTLDLPPSTERHVDAQLSPFSNTTAAAAGNAVTLRVPMPSGPSNVGFVTHRLFLLPF